MQNYFAHVQGRESCFPVLREWLQKKKLKLFTPFTNDAQHVRVTILFGVGQFNNQIQCDIAELSHFGFKVDGSNIDDNICLFFLTPYPDFECVRDIELYGKKIKLFQLFDGRIQNANGHSPFFRVKETEFINFLNARCHLAPANAAAPVDPANNNIAGNAAPDNIHIGVQNLQIQG